MNLTLEDYRKMKPVSVEFVEERRWGNVDQYVYLMPDGNHWAFDIYMLDDDEQSFENGDIEGYQVELQEVVTKQWVPV